MTGSAIQPEREWAEVTARYNSPGPGQEIRYNITVHREGGKSPGTTKYKLVKSVGEVPGDNGSLQYDIIGAVPGSVAQIVRRGTQIRFQVPWMPLTGRCPGTSNANGPGGTKPPDVPGTAAPADGDDTGNTVGSHGTPTGGGVSSL